MSRDDHDLVSKIFLKAIDLDPYEQAECLDEACGDDADLRSRVEALLAQDREPPTFLRDGLVPRIVNDEAEESPERIGPYRIVQRIGEGGMGIVYRAVQETPIRRPVALKLIRSGLATREVLARFETERQALAVMNHPNITRVFDAGTTEDGRPYFAMEFVEGEPITDFCDLRGLGIRERLQLFLRVCEGVQHAHQNAILHRDIKASNVLVSLQDERAVPKIIDFGIAKALGSRLEERVLVTELDQIVGTPEYMSPEQAGAGNRITDTRTDVYSLGVLLYELLTGSLPFDPKLLRGADPDEIRRIIREDTPQRPSTRITRSSPGKGLLVEGRDVDARSLARRLAGDLDWITMKALEKDPDRRYASPSLLASDIRRHLSNEPVVAGPPTLAYRTRKFLRRHRTGASFAAVVAMLVVAAVTVGVMQARRIAKEADRARRQAEATEQVSGFLVQMLASSSALGPRNDPTTLVDILDRGMDRVRSELNGDPVLKARVLRTLGDVYRRLGAHEQAAVALREAREDLARLLGPDHPEALEAALLLARLYLDTSRLQEAEPLYREVIAARTRVSGPDHPATLRAASRLSYLYMRWDRHEEAEAIFEDTLPRMRQVLGEEDPETLITGGFLAGVYLERERYDLAEPLLLHLAERMPRVLGERHLERLAVEYNLGCLYVALGNRERAISHLRRAVDLGFSYGTNMLADPSLEPLHGDPELEKLARKGTLNNPAVRAGQLSLFDCVIRQRDYSRAEMILHEIHSAVRRVGQSGSSEEGDVLNRFAYLYVLQGRYDEAERLLESALGDDPAKDAPDEWIAGQMWLGLATARAWQGDTEGALEALGAVDRLAARSMFFPHDPLSAYLSAFRNALEGKPRQARQELRRAVDNGFDNIELLECDPTLAPLQNDPEYRELLDRVKDRAWSP